MAAESDRGRGRSDDTMERTTIRLPTVLVDALEEYAEDCGYPSASEAHREALRQFIPDEYFPLREHRPVSSWGGGDD